MTLICVNTLATLPPVLFPSTQSCADAFKVNREIHSFYTQLLSIHGPQVQKSTFLLLREYLFEALLLTCIKLFSFNITLT